MLRPATGLLMVAMALLAITLTGCSDETILVSISTPTDAPAPKPARTQTPIPIMPTPLPTPTATPTPKPTATPTPTPTPITASRCIEAPDALVRQLFYGLTAEGATTLTNVHYAENNDGRPWLFIAGRVEAPGMDETLTWGTPYLDESGAATILAVDRLTEEFSDLESLRGGGFP